MSDAGHNVTDDRLRLLIERIERLEVEKAEISEQIKEVYNEAKGNGFDAKALRQHVDLTLANSMKH